MKLTTEHTLAKLHAETVRIAAQAELDRLAPGRFTAITQVHDTPEHKAGQPHHVVGLVLSLRCAFTVLPRVCMAFQPPTKPCEVASLDPLYCDLITVASTTSQPQARNLFEVCRILAQGFEPTTKDSTS